MPRYRDDSDPPKWTVAAIVTASGATIAETMKACNVHERTVFKWRRNPKFRARVDTIRRAMIEAAASKLCDSMSRAVDALIELLGHEEPSVRLRAIENLLSYGFKGNTEILLRRELERAEAKLAARVGGEPGPAATVDPNLRPDERGRDDA
jgi:hypothetical protein